MRKLIRALPPVTFAAVALIAWFTPASQSQADHDSFNSSPTSTNSFDPLVPYPTSTNPFVPLTPCPSGWLDEPLSEGQFDDFVSVLSADTVSEEQVLSAVDAILENDISETEAESLAQSEKVLESIDGDQAVEIFAAIELDGLTDEEGAEIVDAVQKADNDVRGAFEDELNIF